MSRIQDRLSNDGLKTYADEMDRIEGAWIHNLAAKIFRRLNREQALLALLTAAMVVDGRRAISETAEYEALIGRSHALSRLSPSQMRLARAKVTPRLEGKALLVLINQACEVLRGKRDWCNSAFAHAVDMVMADSEILESERLFLADIAFKMEIDPTVAEKIMKVMSVKNEHTQPGEYEGIQILSNSGSSEEVDRRRHLIQKAAEGMVGLSEHQALYAILVAASLADGHAQSEERIEISALFLRSKTLVSLTPDKQKQLRDQMIDKLRPEKISDTVKLACSALPSRLRLAAYANACDVSYADRKLLPQEERFLAHLSIELGLSPAQVEEVNEVIALKNKK